MSKKRRMFDIDMPDDAPAAGATFPAGKVSEPSVPARRGPMASAIAESSDSARDRAALEAQIRAENDTLAHEFVRLKKAGLVVDRIPLDQIETYKLVRDRLPGADEYLPELVASIRDLGLSNPIQVEPREDGRYELIQGFRRIQAYRALLEETGDAERWGAIPAGIVATGDALEALYRRMVDENMVRKDISFAEMAQLALNYAADPETKEQDPNKAVAELFRSASYSKRSYIRSFIRVMRELGEDLQFAAEIPRALGVRLAARFDEMEGVPGAIRAELKTWENRSIVEELNVLRRFAGGDGGALPEPASKPPAKAVVSGPQGSKAKTTFQMTRPHGRAKCTAANGRIEIRMERDFSAVDRRKLELAVQRFLDQLD
ncbi:ParB/RepB/Spo0J family partition protein [Dinoroseobacter sp. S76]|uniref:ParB/RepB/Spo0J family partition protein n=1 Tax=Dinoroseobacter sp. S76 TaxID=3415124 RepID=UPI003C7E3CD0